MPKQIDYHDFTTESGDRVRVALLDNGAIRVSYRNRCTVVTRHMPGSMADGRPSNTIITPAE
jgi:hypothetical protein